MNRKKQRFQLWTQVKVIILLISGFCLGIIAMILLERPQVLNKEPNTIKLEELEEREESNQRLMQGMDSVSIEKEIYFDHTSSKGQARIENLQENTMLVTASIMLDIDGSIVYQSDIIEPGYYIEEIALEKTLQKGAHACTVVWEFYDKESEQLIGETAMKIVVIIKE